MISVEQLVELKDIFPEENYLERMDFIKKFDKETILTVLSAINCFPKKYISSEYSENNQIDIIEFLSKPNLQLRDAILHDFYQLTNGKKFPAVFHRAANVVAIEEVLVSNLPNNGGQKLSDKSIILFIKYYLSINSLIVENQSFLENTSLNDLELFVGGVSATNELNLPYFSDLDILRFQELIDYLISSDKYGEFVSKYFKTIGVNAQLYSLWGFKSIIPIQQSELIIIPTVKIKDDTDRILFNRFSASPNLTGQSPIEIVNVKKNPFWKLDDDFFLLLDFQALIDKSYHSFINDIWFDYLKPNDFNRAHFMGEIGYFFEEYIARKFKTCYSLWNNPPVKATDDLLVRKGKGQIEVADVYMRHFKKVIVGQAKVSAINSREKYTFHEGGIFKLSKDKFYKTFGLNQMVENTIANFVSNPRLFDDKFPVKGSIKVYPLLIVNERMLLNPLINKMFQDYFLTKLKEKFGEDIQIPINKTGDAKLHGRLIIRPITIMYIAELEMMQIHVKSDEYQIWKFLDYHIAKTGLLEPLNVSLNKKLGLAYKVFLENNVLPLLKTLIT